MTKVTVERKAKFLAALAANGANVRRAAEVVGISRMHLYRLRAAEPDFAAAWNEALDLGTEALEDEAIRRAHDGVDEPVFYQGSQCGVVRKYSDTLMIFMLKARRPERYREAVEHKHSGQVTLEHLVAASMPTKEGG